MPNLLAAAEAPTNAGVNDAPQPLAHLAPLAVPQLFERDVPVPTVHYKGAASYQPDASGLYMQREREFEDNSWCVFYGFGPDGLTIHSMIWAVEGTPVTGDAIRQEVRHYRDVWTRIAEACLDHYEVVASSDPQSIAETAAAYRPPALWIGQRPPL